MSPCGLSVIVHFTTLLIFVCLSIYLYPSINFSYYTRWFILFSFFYTPITSFYLRTSQYLMQHRGKGVLIISYETQRRYSKMFEPAKVNPTSSCDLLICDEVCGLTLFRTSLYLHSISLLNYTFRLLSSAILFLYSSPSSLLHHFILFFSYFFSITFSSSLSFFPPTFFSLLFFHIFHFFLSSYCSFCLFHRHSLRPTN